MSYEGEDPEPHPDADKRSSQVCPTEEQASQLREKVRDPLSAAFKVRLRAAGIARSRTAHGLKLWSKGVDQSSLWVERPRLPLTINSPILRAMSSSPAYRKARCFGPAGPNPRIDRDVKKSSILKLCGRDVSERIHNGFKLGQTADPDPELTLWLRLRFDPSTGFPCEAEAPYYIDVNGLRYDISRTFIGDVEQAAPTIFVMSDRKKPRLNKGKPNK